MRSALTAGTIAGAAGLILVAALTTSSGSSAEAAGPAGLPMSWMQVDSIQGESTGKGHETWIDLDRVQLSAASSDSATARAGADFKDIRVVKGLDRATPKLWQAAALGTHIPNVTIETQIPQSGSACPCSLQRIALKDVMISSMTSAADNSSMGIKETVDLSYAKISITHQTQAKNLSWGPTTVFNYTLTNPTIRLI